MNSFDKLKMQVLGYFINDAANRHSVKEIIEKVNHSKVDMASMIQNELVYGSYLTGKNDKDDRLLISEKGKQYFNQLTIDSGI